MKHFATALPSGDKAISAIEKTVNLITALGPSQIPIKPGGWLKFEPRLGFELAPQINVGVIQGGISRQIQDWRPALLPDFCTMLLDVRTIPGMNFDTVERDLIDLLRPSGRFNFVGRRRIGIELELEKNHYGVEGRE